MFLQDIPEFMGVDGLNYGPFKEGDIVDIPELNSQGLVKKSVAKTIPKISANPAQVLSGQSSTDSFFVNVSNSKPDNWGLPGQAPIETDPSNCGYVHSAAKCPECDTRVVFRNSCDKPECPTCHKSYASKHGGDVAEYLDGCNRAYYNAGVRLGYFKHYTLSPPQEWAVERCRTLSGYNYLKRLAIDHAKKLGVVGGSIVFHYYRIIPELIPLLNNAGYGNGRVSYGSLWDGVLSDVLGLGSCYKYVKPAPHFHITGVGYNKDTKAYYDLTGWMLKQISTLNEKNTNRRYLHLRNIATYQLHHATRYLEDFKFRNHAVTYFGAFASKYVHVTDKWSVLEKVPCPACNKFDQHGNAYLWRCSMSLDPALSGREEGIMWDVLEEELKQPYTYRFFELRSDVNNPYLMFDIRVLRKQNGGLT